MIRAHEVTMRACVGPSEANVYRFLADEALSKDHALARYICTGRREAHRLPLVHQSLPRGPTLDVARDRIERASYSVCADEFSRHVKDRLCK